MKCAVCAVGTLRGCCDLAVVVAVSLLVVVRGGRRVFDIFMHP
jgi:hypothetical protein